MHRTFPRHERHSERHSQRHSERHSQRHTIYNNIKNKKSLHVHGGVASAHADLRARAHGRRCSRPTASRCAANCQQLEFALSGAGADDDCRHPEAVANCVYRCKKVAKSLEDSKKSPIFAGMKERKYIITGINKLSGHRDQISRAMSEQEARERLEREIANRKLQRYQPYSRLKIEPYEAVQLTIQFKEYE